MLCNQNQNLVKQEFATREINARLVLTQLGILTFTEYHQESPLVKSFLVEIYIHSPHSNYPVPDYIIAVMKFIIATSVKL